MARTYMLIAGALAAVLGGCRETERQAETATPAPPPEPPSAVYRCDNGANLRVSYPDANTALVNYQQRLWTLKRGRAASGSRYAANGLQWWAKDKVQAEITTLADGEAAAAEPGLRCILSSAAAELTAIAAPPPPSAAPSATPGATASGPTVAEARFSPQSAQAAAEVVRAYFNLIEGRRYGEAWRLWADEGVASGMNEGAFTASFGRYGAYHANVGEPGPVEARGGALFVEVPVQVYGRLRTGAPMTLLGSVGLVREGEGPDVDPEQLQWRIAASDLKAASARQ